MPKHLRLPMVNPGVPLTWQRRVSQWNQPATLGRLPLLPSLIATLSCRADTLPRKPREEKILDPFDLAASLKRMQTQGAIMRAVEGQIYPLRREVDKLLSSSRES